MPAKPRAAFLSLPLSKLSVDQVSNWSGIYAQLKWDDPIIENHIPVDFQIKKLKTIARCISLRFSSN